MGKLCIAYLGNFGVPFSTESHIAETLADMGHTVCKLQENEVDLPQILAACRGADILLWTKTGQWLKCNGFEMLSRVKVPTVGIHLDVWWGLNRESEISTSPFFACKHVFTADGGNDEKFKAAGVKHHWLRPGVLKRECYLAEPRNDLKCDIGFVGSYNYHPEHWRTKLIDWLRETYGPRFRLFGSNGDSWRGDDLNRLYSSIGVSVGDSCFADKIKRYTSDRLYESCGRGAFTAFPRIEGIDHDYETHRDLFWYRSGDYEDLKRVIDHMLSLPPSVREEVRRNAVEHTRTHHAYHNRMREMLHVLAGHEELIREQLEYDINALPKTTGEKQS